MAQPAANPRAVRFGLFELDLESRELRKSGVRIKLQDQPFQILAMLLERPGVVVTREELQKKLWPGDTFVDFDLSLNSAVKKLRQALSDDSDNPRYIETLYRRGYRFIGPVNGASGQIELVESPASNSRLQPLTIPPAPLPSVSKKRLLVYGLAVAALLLLMAVFAYRFVSTQPPRVVGFTQITHDGLSKLQVFNDGERLYLTELQGNRFVVNQVSASGGETGSVPTPFSNLGIRGMAPDGSALIVTPFEGTGGETQTWSVPLPSGPLRRITEPAFDFVAWSPDGKQAAFSQGSDIYLANGDLSKAHKLATAAGFVLRLRFSPDGRRIGFDLPDSAQTSSSIWEVATDGSKLRPMLPASNSVPHECCGNWTPDGKYFLYQSFREGRNSIWALPQRSSWLSGAWFNRTWFNGTPKPVQLTNGPLDFRLPVVSKDGNRIFAVGSQPRCEMVRYNGKAGFEPFLDGASIRDLAFSADGKWIAYVTVPEGQLWRSRVDGSERLQLTPGGMDSGLPRWAPDGKQIVFMGTSYKTDWRAYLISSDGTDLRELIPGAKSGYDPSWSPDGKSIALGFDSGGTKENPNPSGIAIYDLEAKKLSTIPDSIPVFSPRWSPDGRYIAAVTNDSLKLKLFDRVTQKWQDLVSMPIGYPSWSHDGQYIYFDTTLSDDAAFLRVRISDHKVERLLSLKAVRQYWGPFGSWTGLAPDDSLLLVRDIGSQEVYALDLQTP